MRCTHCAKCCWDTQMELCKADRIRLVRRGYHEDDFCRKGEDGIYRLKNVDGHCFFLDTATKRCREYRSRPLGCSIYPVNLTDDGELVIDDICPEGGSMDDDEMLERGRRLKRLLETIDAEAARDRNI